MLLSPCLDWVYLFVCSQIFDSLSAGLVIVLEINGHVYPLGFHSLVRFSQFPFLYLNRRDTTVSDGRRAGGGERRDRLLALPHDR